MSASPDRGDAVLAAARRWLAEDPDPGTRAQLQQWIDAQDLNALNEAFGQRLQFGTAGLRGVLGPGPGGMNRALVRRVSAGLARYVAAHVADATVRGLVVGFDGRHLSREMAWDTARVFAAEGFRVYLYPTEVPTPLVPFAVGRFEAACGVVVTASHNPPEYNGYKVYWENGAQIVPPHDAGISAAIDAVAGLSDVTLVEPGTEDHTRIEEVPVEVEQAYVDAAVALRRSPQTPRSLSVVYTPLHGVGARFVEAVLQRDGATSLHTVPQQAQPDGDFPTVRFPNPEEDGALDLALALAQEKQADLIVANDPDADRLAAAIPDPDADSGFRALSGNEIGALLGFYLLTEWPEGGPVREPLVMTTIVSGRILSRIAARLGAHYEETLTGFKWIANRSQELHRERGWNFVFGFEEALGYTVGTLTPDKDGVSAALLMVELAALCRSRSLTVRRYLDDIYTQCGFSGTRQHSLTLPGSEGRRQIDRLMASLRAGPPASLDNRPVTSVVDYREGVAGIPVADVVALEVDGGGRILVRPSGTEPKIKFYLEQEADASILLAAQREAEVGLGALEAAVLEWARGVS